MTKSQTPIPPHGSPVQTVLERLEGYRSGDLDWRTGKVWAYQYDPGAEAEGLIKQAYMAYLSENGLDPTAYPSLVRFENEIIAMASAHLGGDEATVGNFSSGGTESIILACKAARDWARSKRPELARSAQRPKIVLPTTAHAAFHKAASYLDLEKVMVDVDPVSYRAVPEAMAAAIDDDCIMMVGSAVSYAHCVIDPIVELAAIAKARGLWMHVDGCMGGFLLPFFRRLGRDVPPFDLSVDGVSSISMDLHKYAFAAKGASVVLYRDKSLRKHQIFTGANWTGYTITNPTVQSTKSGGPVAAAWAILQHIGQDGYLEMARAVLAGTDKVMAFVESHPDLQLLGRSDMNHVSFASDTIPIFRLADAVNKRGWYVQVQLGYRWEGGASPANIHLVINPSNMRWLDTLLADIAACVEEVRDSQPSALVASLAQMVGQIDLASLDDETLRQMMGMAGITPGVLPKVGAEINEVLDMLPPAFRERVLTEFANELYV